MVRNLDTQQHEMQFVRTERNEKDDIEFEFVCLECGYREVVPFLEVFICGDLSVSHEISNDGGSALLIRVQKGQTNLPECFKDFFGSLEN